MDKEYILNLLQAINDCYEEKDCTAEEAMRSVRGLLILIGRKEGIKK